MTDPTPTLRDPASLPYRPCVGLMVINHAGRVWAGARADSKNEAEGHGTWWQMPQGGIDGDEVPEAAARRELFEETGIRSVVQLAELPRWLNYDLPTELVGKAWGGRYRGQKQRWFLYRFTGDDGEINIAPAVGHEPEFIAWDWVAMPRLLELIVPFKREVYREVLAEFGPLVRPV